MPKISLSLLKEILGMKKGSSDFYRSFYSGKGPPFGITSIFIGVNP
jgi:hypothetical protein